MPYVILRAIDDFKIPSTLASIAPGFIATWTGQHQREIAAWLVVAVVSSARLA
jgi:hypothetical protein